MSLINHMSPINQLSPIRTDYTTPPEAPDVWSMDFAMEILPDLLRGLWITVQATVLGISVALVLGLILAILRRSPSRLVRWPVSAFIEFVRSTPLLAQLFFLFFGLPAIGIRLSPMVAGVIGLAIHYACYTSEAYRAGIANVPRGQWEAATSLNLTRTQTWLGVVLPQAIPTVIPALGNYVVAMFKDAPLLASITVIELLATAQRIQGFTFRGLEPFTLAGLLFLAVSLPAALVVRTLERRYAHKRA